MNKELVFRVFQNRSFMILRFNVKKKIKNNQINKNRKS